MANKWICFAIEVLLNLFFHFTRFCGICSLNRHKERRSDNRFNIAPYSKGPIYTVTQCTWHKWLFGIFRILSAIGYLYGNLAMWYTADQFFNLINILQSTLSVSGSIALSVVLMRSDVRFANNGNYFLYLYHRIQRLAPDKSMMGLHQLIFLLIIFVCMGNDLLGFCVLRDYKNVREMAVVAAKLFLDMCLVISMHVASIGFICIGALYGFMNAYMREVFEPRARCLDYVLKQKHNYRLQMNQRKLIRLTRELNECTSIYNDIYCAANTFHHSIRYQIFFALLFEFSLFTTIIYSMLYVRTVLHDFHWDAVVYSGQIFIGVLILILSVYSAVQSGLTTRNLSLDSVYMAGNTEWNRSVSTMRRFLKNKICNKKRASRIPYKVN